MTLLSATYTFTLLSLPYSGVHTTTTLRSLKALVLFCSLKKSAMEAETASISDRLAWDCST